MFVGAAVGSLGRHTRVTPDGMPIFDGRMEVFFKIIYISQLTQTVTFGLTKIAVVLFYRRIFVPRTFSIISLVMIGLNITWTIAFFAANLLQCWPISGNWTGLDAAPGTCIDTTMMYLAQAWSDVFTDIVILSMPIPWIWRLQMAPMRKFFVVLMLQLGALVVCAGVAKLVVFHRITYDTAVGDEDLTYLLTPTVYWPMVESSLGIVGACLPLLRPVFTDSPAKSIFSSLRAMISLSSLRSNDARKPSGDYDKLEAGNVGASQNSLVDGAQVV
ncbi:hypothetical protein HO173_008673 [Letharia columbiana]|uniref:Rhodopsin domain-containing protein n=1 Tax=Letharia columbiana TaxID=112416 RepID=A0A8H6FR35_9LECA|nr:uncharacterized protein HO173_008673 [Letharia columbiana]KAF6233129.1 hypothetical protein HO173_008673 [Letharia columbiana]